MTITTTLTGSEKQVSWATDIIASLTDGNQINNRIGLTISLWEDAKDFLISNTNEPFKAIIRDGIAAIENNQGAGGTGETKTAIKLLARRLAVLIRAAHKNDAA